MRPTRSRPTLSGRAVGTAATALATAAALVTAGALATPAFAAPGKPAPVPSGSPLLSPEDGAYLEGTETIAADPTMADDDVVALAVDGAALDADQTVGVSRFSFEVGSNSTEARYGNYILVNGDHRIDIPDLVDERATFDVPNEHLVQGENTIEIITGTIDTSCGVNHDDFVLSNFSLELLGEVADGEENEYRYAFGDGSCGSNSSLLLDAALTFVVLGDPQRTTGLTTDLDTTTLTNGAHVITATTASGASVGHTVRVNNAPAGAPRLAPSDGTIARGTQPVFASTPAAGDGGVAAVAVDGHTVPTRPTLGSGDAVFSFTVGSNSIEARYDSYLLVNGMKLDIGGDYASERVDVALPNEWLLPGDNTVSFVTGTFRTSCGDNRDDYVISDIALTPAQGTAVGQALQTSYRMGDGNCGSNSSLLRDVDLAFAVDAPARGLRSDLDTAELQDGEHRITATSNTGEVATRALFTDNTGPAVSASTPAPGDTITSSVPLDVQLDDPSGVISGPDVTLDGTVVALGDLIGPGLSAGRHTLAVTATDSLGNTATHDIVFDSAGIPDMPTDMKPASGATSVATTTNLEARVGEPDGGQVTATFSQTDILTPARGWHGTAPSIPTTLRVPGERNIGDTGALVPGDNRTLESPAGPEITYQRFDIQIQGFIDTPVLRWEGVVDPARIVSLRAWNLQTQAWDPLASRRGEVEGATVLTASAGAEYIDRQQVHVLVTGEDPFADDIDPGSKDGFDDPGSYDFSIVHFTDTQYLAEGAVEQETAAERAIWEAAYAGVVDWVAQNADERKIAYVAHTGDLIENNIRRPTTPQLQEQVIGEFEVSSRQHKVLDDAGIANGVIAGNHDNQSGTETGPDAIYNRYFGADRYADAARRWSDAEYGGPWREGDNQNHYDLFTAGGLDFVVVGLSYGVSREEAEWADSIFKRFPDRNGILLSHDYLAPSSNPDGRGATFSAPDGSMLYNTVVQNNPNVFLILAGHEHGVGTNVKPEAGAVGNGVVELLADYQFYTVSADRLGLTDIGGYDPDTQLRFGASYLRMLQFDVDRGEMSVDTYSPLLDDFGATEFDTNRRYNGLEDNMVLPVDLTSRTTSVATASVALYAPTGVIGETVVGSGEVASVPWDGLRPGTAYAWVVTARSAGGGVTSSRPNVFATVDDRGRPSAPDTQSSLAPYFEQPPSAAR